MPDAVLEVRGLVKRYGAVEALKGIDLTIEKGSIYGFIGPNGAGKTTTIRIVAGLVRPSAGSVRLHGIDLAGDRLAAAKGLRTLVEVPAFYPGLTGLQNLSIFARLAGAKREEVLRLLDRVGLTPAKDRAVGGYSPGMRQRLGIAQAIAGDPSLVIVDEPTAGLDPEERLRFYHLLTELAEERTVLLSTHIVEDVAVLCPQFAVIRGGRLVARTTPRSARASLQGHIFEGVVSPADMGDLRATRAVTQTLLVEGRHRVRLYEPDSSPPAGFMPVEPSLEDAYLVLMRLGELPGAEQIDITTEPAPATVGARR